MSARRIVPICLRQARTIASRPSIQPITSRICNQRILRTVQHRTFATPVRYFATQSIADVKIEEIQELYATARDEFEIAAEETEKMTVYAEDDRAAAREELTKLQEAYRACVEGEDRAVAEEVKRRIGQRIRELENAVTAMEEMALHQD